MPSGSKVIVGTRVTHYSRGRTIFDVYVFPLRVDAYRTTGLCGNYNLDPDDELSDLCSTECDQYRQDIFVTTFYHRRKMYVICKF